jgi:glycosyltransferase involved in cell wall biosynthesis
MFVSFLLAVYNGAAYLAEAIESILAQTYTNFECIIVNDGSTDASPQIIAEYAAKDSRIVVLNAPQNQGLIASLNWGVATAKGEYIARLDADDIALPHRLATQVAYLAANPEVVLLGTGAEIIDEKGNFLHTQHYHKAQEAMRVHLLFHNIFIHSSVMVKTAILREFPFQNEDYLAEDYAVWLKIAEKYKVAMLYDALVKHRTHETNITKVKYERHLQTVYRIFARQLNDLGIEANNTQLELHRKIGAYQLCNDLQFLQAAADWLSLLYQQNQQLRKYPEPYFTNWLLLLWLDTVTLNLPLGKQAQIIFKQATITKALPWHKKLRWDLRFWVGK